MQESSRRVFPHWSEKPPDGYPFMTYPLNFQEAQPKARPLLQELTTIGEAGKRLLDSKNYQDALWKYENCLLIARNMYEVDQIVRYASNCALVLLKLHQSIEDDVQKKRAIEFCKQFCLKCFELPINPQRLAKVRCMTMIMIRQSNINESFAAILSNG